MANNIHAEQIKLVFFDIDETLYVKDKAYVPPSVYTAIRKLKERGIVPGIATGRARGVFPREIDELIEQENINMMVTINGQHNSYQGKVIERHPIAIAKIERLIEFFEQHRIIYAFISNERIAVSAITPEMQAALNPITTEYVVDKQHYRQHEVYQMLAFYDASQDALIQASGVLGGDLKVLRWHKYSVDVLEDAGSKARGIDTLARHLGYTADNVMAFGDGINDSEMIAHVGLGVAMGNALPELKQMAQYVTSDIEDDGILNALIALKIIDHVD